MGSTAIDDDDDDDDDDDNNNNNTNGTPWPESACELY
jgi:hypothetical protein